MVSDVGGLPESIINNVNGFLTAPDDVKGQVSSLLKLCNSSTLRSSMGEKGKEHAEKIYSFKSWKLKIYSLYENTQVL